MATLLDPIGAAQQTWLAAGGQTGVKAYDLTIELVDAQMARAPSRSVSLNSETDSSNISHTWANGSVEGFYDVFFGEAGSSYDAMTSVVTSAGVDISIQFTHIATLPVLPLRTGSIVAGPTTYQAWYVPAALQAAYNNNSSEIWQPTPPNWASFFGDSGSLPRGTAALVVVDGINVSLTSLSSIAVANRKEVQASFAAGFFPFFGVSGSGGWTNSFTYNDDGSIVATSRCDVNNPQVLGVLVLPIAPLIAGPDLMEAARVQRARAPGRLLPRPQPRPATAAMPAPMVNAEVLWSSIAQAGLEQVGDPEARSSIKTQVESMVEGKVQDWDENSAHFLKVTTGGNRYIASVLVNIADPGRYVVTVTNFG